MTREQIIFTTVTFLHDLFTVVWVGGLVTLTATVFPAARKALAGRDARVLMQAVQRRLRVFVYISIAGLIATGVLLTRRSVGFEGLFSWSGAYATALGVKHVLVLVMIVIALVRSLVFGKKKAALPQGSSSADPTDGQRSPGPLSGREKVSAMLLFLNTALGVAVLYLSGLGTALGSPPHP